MRRVGSERVRHPDLDPEFLELYFRCAPFTALSIERINAICDVARALLKGDYVECSMWRRGLLDDARLCAKRIGLSVRFGYMNVRARVK